MRGLLCLGLKLELDKSPNIEADTEAKATVNAGAKAEAKVRKVGPKSQAPIINSEYGVRLQLQVCKVIISQEGTSQGHSIIKLKLRKRLVKSQLQLRKSEYLKNETSFTMCYIM